MNIPSIDLARTGANILNFRKAAAPPIHDLQMAFGFNSPQVIYKWQNPVFQSKDTAPQTYAYTLPQTKHV